MTKNHLPLLEETKARVFLKKALATHSFNVRKMSISEFSKVAGFSSRSFISEYLSGRKRLSRESFDKIKTALKLPKVYKQYFAHLVQFDQPELFKNKTINLQELKKISENLKKQELTLSQVLKPEEIINKAFLFRLYASLGTEDQGVSISEIIKKTNLKLKDAENGLNVLIKSKMVKFSDARYYPLTSKIDLKSVDLADLVKQVCTEIGNDLENTVQNRKNIILYSCFSMNSDDLIRFKEKMSEAIYSVMDEFQDDRGDCVRQFFTSSF